jgi:parallel beta-helix repeat protein
MTYPRRDVLRWGMALPALAAAARKPKPGATFTRTLTDGVGLMGRVVLVGVGAGTLGTVVLRPGDNVPAIVAANPENTTFLFSPGTYTLTTQITPKNGDVFDGQNRGATLDGGGTAAYAFRATGTYGVTIRGLVIQNFATPLQDGAIQAFDNTHWTVDNNWITLNAASAIAGDTGFQVINNLMDHNGQQGYAQHGQDWLYQNNEIAYNNENLVTDATWEAGGGKAYGTLHGRFLSNHVHHNGGHGIWTDTNNRFITYDGNNCHHNWGAGIYHEISYEATIINNTIANNGTSVSQGGGQDLGWMFDAGIQLRSSQSMDASNPILIEGNTVTDNYNGIGLIDSPPTTTNPVEGQYSGGTNRLGNITVRNNTITQHEGMSGVVQDGIGSSVFTSAGIVWTGNDWLSPSAHPADGHADNWWAFSDGARSFTSWQGFGLDTTASGGSWTLI